MLGESTVELRRFGLKTALIDFCYSFPYITFDYFGSEERIDTPSCLGEGTEINIEFNLNQQADGNG